ncbi:DUF2561 family protein [Mycobacterium montefiorense]|uniref:DUF2561 domain-containing protein n=2 Tax=Mycobacterium montefiorense TaxID=154654 RepID=A0ABQ0NK18_9MYCO|nr:DUF2561 family protein [Mycobacterium montefiorense]GBG37208.1 hypothetical protein MmonteBS_15800 [Mycobacterium montefiorense]GKU34080.1 hypothetical protein NJB14191_14260 [Mycobacterium montefiorense]GKU47697.1 hypothetical protein NJB14194_43150 [Mycobacterium montefiorense]GKU51949.1 hypothetical protein NJB14195_31930 [Mycobacterium montefiorense]GKU55152.1 hypothetical protein NJB14197_10210 [Mycobacterium montefiorense]
MVSRYSAYRRGSDTVPPDVIDRLLLGTCAAIWLLLLGVSVAAAVALADLGGGLHSAARNTHSTPWVLYAVIIVSALIIAGAVPVLLRARRMTRGEPPVVRSTALQGRPQTKQPATRTVVERVRQQRGQAVGSAGDWSGEAVDRIWLRGTVVLTGAMGIALIAVAAATYSMAVGHDGPSWVFYGLAGVVTAAMPAVEWFFVRQLRREVAAG